MLISYGLIPTEKTEKITRSLIPSGSMKHLWLMNVNGEISVSTTEGNSVEILVEKTLKTDIPGALKAGWQEVNLRVVEVPDGYLVYTDIPCTEIDMETKEISYCQREEDYTFRMNYNVKVPAEWNLTLKNMNHGNIRTEGVRGDISVCHVNGSVSITGAAGSVDASTANGELYVKYADPPVDGSSFKTLNGDIVLDVPGHLDATVDYKTMLGNVYTNFSEVTESEILPVATTDRSEGTSRYLLEVRPQIIFGRGGPGLSFETLNGSIYIQNNHIQ